MKKETKGILSKIQESGNVVNYTPGALTLDKFNEFNKSINEAHSKPIVALTSMDNGNYLDAVMANDHVKIKFYENKFKQQAIDRQNSLYKRMKKELSWYGYRIFKKIDDKFDRRFNETKWTVKDIMVQYGEVGYYDPAELSVRLRNGKYTLSIWYCDETGYDQGQFTIAKDVSARNIFKEIEKVKLNPIFRQ